MPWVRQSQLGGRAIPMSSGGAASSGGRWMRASQVRALQASGKIRSDFSPEGNSAETSKMSEREAPGWGPMSRGQELGFSLAGLGAKLAGAPLGAGLSLMSLASKAARMAGVPSVTNPLAGIPTLEAIRMASIYDPNRAVQLAQQREKGIQAGVASVYGPPEDPMSRLAEAYANWGGPSSATPGVGMADVGGPAGMAGGEPGGEGMGGGGGGGIGGSSGEGAGMFARGGVARAITGPKRMVIGEAGPEFAIAVPLEMLQPGLQGREEEVRKMLHAAMLALGAMGRP